VSAEAVRRIERALCCVLAPLTGTRSSGAVHVAAAAGDVAIPARTYGTPVIVSAAGSAQVDPSRLIKTTEDAVVTAAGVDIPVVSALGGPAMNLAAGTRIRWSPSIDGLAGDTVVNAPGLAGGAAGDAPGTVRRVLVFEGIAGANAAEIWRAAGAGGFPAIVIGWQSASESKRVGNQAQLREHTFRIHVITSRLDSIAERQDEGKVILEAIAELLCDRGAVDGECFSAPPARLAGAGRLAIDPGSLVYYQDVAVLHTVRMVDARVFAEWTKTREQLQTYPADLALNPIVLTTVDQSHNQ
jgi:hypothetical protein